MQTYIPFKAIAGFAAAVACFITAGVIAQNAFYPIGGIIYCAILGGITLKKCRP